MVCVALCCLGCGGCWGGVFLKIFIRDLGKRGAIPRRLYSGLS